jgi:hypothetical protein
MGGFALSHSPAERIACFQRQLFHISGSPACKAASVSVPDKRTSAAT